MKVKLAEALLRRKELQEKVDVLRQVDEKALYDVRAERRQVTESLDDIVAQVPKLDPEQVTAAFDWHERQPHVVARERPSLHWAGQQRRTGRAGRTQAPGHRRLRQRNQKDSLMRDDGAPLDYERPDYTPDDVCAAGWVLL